MSDLLSRDLSRLPDLLEQARASALEFLTTLPERPAGIRPAPPAPLGLPEAGLGAGEALALFRRRYEAGLSGSAGSRYLGFVTGGTTPAALVGDWLVSAYDQNVSNDGDSLATSVEREALGLLRSLFGLPEAYEGAFVSGATAANLVSLATARQWAMERLGHDVSEEGLWGLPRIAVLGGAPHASVLKALSILGMGRRAVEAVPCLPDRPVMDPKALEARLAALGGAPAIVLASAGEVNTGDFDDLEAVGPLCRRYGAWLHVDGAFGIFAACSPAHAHLLRGLAHADSVAADGHKWLNVPYDSGLVFTRHLALQERVFRAVAAYLGQGPDLLHRTPENSRRFRALPAWMTLMAYGRDGHRALVERSCALARGLGEGLAASPRYALLAPVTLNIVCFALRSGDASRRDQLLAALQADGRVHFTPTQYAGRPGLRAAFSNWRTGESDLPIILAALEAAASRV
ncbi:pyridoxal phosphate-dependent decarboxylase family protein [Corallococcus carmarthensis]|uniref:Aspartate aminotransferase family protein n=1 Tax=Corallococcus carmarthensis TaxID=2316728 RepID=A0A3A8JNV8_9BACT|nr:pyridoxal-dependent decarboxylase [Corallococcus carmarthensis]RKG97427.1 aspartate aminotransferase family protein [Corallococcus carmarthensis]